MTIAVPFPEKLPEGYQWLGDEPPFDPGRHLSLESPSQTLSLEDLGYSREEIQDKATTFGVSEPFRFFQRKVRRSCWKQHGAEDFQQRAGNRD